MKLRPDPEGDIAALDLIDDITDGAVARDVGPQLTPNRQWITLAYDADGYLLSIELWAVSKILWPETLRTGDLRLTHDPAADLVVLHLAQPILDSDRMEIGPQRTALPSTRSGRTGRS